MQRRDGPGEFQHFNIIGDTTDKMRDISHKIEPAREQGYITVFGILILIMFLITIYELSVIYADWNRIKLIALNISVLNEQSSPIPGVSLTVDDELIGQTDEEGRIAAFISNPGEVHIVARKKPLRDIDTTVAFEEDGSSVIFSMVRPYAKLTLVTLDEGGAPLKDVSIRVQGKDQGQTGEDGRLTISDYVHILDSAKVKLSKSGFDDLSRDIYLADADNIDSLTMVKRTASSRPEVTAPSRPEVTTPSRPGSDFQTYINAARNYLDRAISGESRYFGRALTEIDKAINANPRSIPARQIKVEILFNFAKSLRESNLPREAINRLGEAQKIYRNIPQDPLYFEIDKLKKELEKEQGG
jgi:hypothetical protein